MNPTPKTKTKSSAERNLQELEKKGVRLRPKASDSMGKEHLWPVVAINMEGYFCAEKKGNATGSGVSVQILFNKMGR